MIDGSDSNQITNSYYLLSRKFMISEISFLLVTSWISWWFPWWTISFVLRLKWEERTAATSSMTMWDNDDCYCDGVVMFYQIHTSPLTWLRFTLTWLQSRFLRLQSTFSFESFFLPTIRPSTFIIHILDCQIILFGLSVETVSIYIYICIHMYIYRYICVKVNEYIYIHIITQ
jgi:hypothetical protein